MVTANSILGDGSVIVGHGSRPRIDGGNGNAQEAFLWENGNVVGLGDLPGDTNFSGGNLLSRANAISEDGSVIVGSSRSSLKSEAFRWENGVMLGIGALPEPDGSFFSSSAAGVSGDGSIIVGNSSSAFIWDQVNGMRNLVDVLTNGFGFSNELSGWSFLGVNAISSDGLIITGTGKNPDGKTEAWAANLSTSSSPSPVPEPSTYALFGFALAGLAVVYGRKRRLGTIIPAEARRKSVRPEFI